MMHCNKKFMKYSKCNGKLKHTEYTKFPRNKKEAKKIVKKKVMRKQKSTMYVLAKITFKGKKYKYFSKKLHWLSAAKDCRRRGGRLASIQSKSDTKSVLRAVGGKSHAWIGLNDRSTEGSWQWAHVGRLGKYKNWAGGEPNGKKRENCVFIYAKGKGGSGKWNDSGCKSKQAYVCENRFYKAKKVRRRRRYVGFRVSAKM